MRVQTAGGIVVLLTVVNLAMGQAGPAAPDQPVRPQQVPTLQLRQVAPPQAPFQLTPEHEAYLEQILTAWEKSSSQVQTFECDFKRWESDPVFGKNTEDVGKLKYAAPDKGMFKVEGERSELWICDGKSIFEYKYQQKELVEHKLPPELQGQAISNGPLPFLFGAKAADLKRRYFMRITTPADAKGEIWMEALPRFQQDAANFQRAELILKSNGMLPHALQIYSPNGKNRSAYQFFNVVLNDPLRFFKGDPFNAALPWGWKKIVEEPESPQVGRQPAATTTR